MDVGIAFAAPAHELDAKLEGGAGAGHELGLVQAEPLVEGADMGKRRLADADDADRLGFDEMDGGAGRQQLGDGGGRHPAGGAAADDDNVHLFLSGHAVPAVATAAFYAS